jgi:hypothetical protein
MLRESISAHTRCLARQSAGNIGAAMTFNPKYVRLNFNFARDHKQVAGAFTKVIKPRSSKKGA